MGRKPAKNPRRERRVTYLTESEAKRLDTLLEKLYPRLDTASDKLREALIQWMEMHQEAEARHDPARRPLPR